MPDYPTIYTVEIPTARKVHVCCECQGEILATEKYHRFQGMWDKEFRTYKTCAECECLRNDVVAETGDIEDWPAFGDLHRHVLESAKPDMVRVVAFMDNRKRRNAPTSPNSWMEEHHRKLKEATND